VKKRKQSFFSEKQREHCSSRLKKLILLQKKKFMSRTVRLLL